MTSKLMVASVESECLLMIRHSAQHAARLGFSLSLLSAASNGLPIAFFSCVDDQEITPSMRFVSQKLR